jgi:glycosyltransferase involved in cell wall biosynthesis
VVPHVIPSKRSLAFAGQLATGLFARLPLAVSRYESAAMRRKISELIRSERFDSVVCDFLAPAANFENPGDCVLFQHNVETIIWQRHVQNASDPLRKAYFGLQATRMFAFERDICRSAAGVVAVSDADASLMQSMFGVPRVSAVPTGVDVDYFTPRETPAEAVADLMFVGSMDWMPNSDGVLFFVNEILPLIRRKRPNCSLAIVGRAPGPEIRALAGRDPHIKVTGTVADVRPYLWGSAVSIVPLRIGGGTRLKIYESMAARTPVVSTTIGAEGLSVESPTDIRLADTPEAFADMCLDLLNDRAERKRIADAGWDLVSTKFSWDHVVRCFEQAIGISVAAT